MSNLLMMKNTLITFLSCAISLSTLAQTPTMGPDTIKFRPGYHPEFTIKANQPLCFLDGKKIAVDSLSFINPHHIESIEIVKGLTAKDRYGEAGKNGAILITLKDIARIKRE